MGPGNSYDIGQPPNILPLYLKILKRRRGIGDGELLPGTRVEWRGFSVDADSVAAYARVCRLRLVRGHLPLLFPHFYFGPLHLMLLTDERFPLKVLGALHLRNHVVQREPLFPGKAYDASLRFVAQRRRPQGLELDLYTCVSAASEPLWESVTTWLFRSRFEAEDPASPRAEAVLNIDEPQVLERFPVPGNTGRAYGRISRDLNPIHMSRLLARAFGFQRDLCHGMWALARGLSFIEGVDEWEPLRNDVVFKGPMYMGRDITVKTAPDDGGHVELYSGDNPRPCVVASLRNVAPGAAL